MLEIVNETEYRFGMVGVKKGFVTVDQVIEALRIQVLEEISTGERRPIGEIMVGNRMLTEAQRDDVLSVLPVP